MPSTTMNQIERVVVLMLENRSLDNVLGWLYETGAPARVVPEGSSPAFDGLTAGTYWNEYKGTKVPVSHGTQGAGQPLRVPGYDPNEPYDDVTVQLFGGADGVVPNPLKSGTAAAMKGFAYNYDAAYESWAELAEVMGAYLPAQLPVLNGLARQYAVSDRWFSSVPTQTNPNRAFTHCGTSLGRVVNGTNAVEQFVTRTIWNALPADVSWGLYYHDIWKSGKCFTEYTFPQIDAAQQAAKRAEIRPIADFYAQAKASPCTLPTFTFLEPAWGYGKGTPAGPFGVPPASFVGIQGNDYHPPTWVGPGEAFVNQVYEALSGNADAWKNTLLIITFDEHGGTYDHVDPGWKAVKPDGNDGPDGFQFDRYGVRVPMIMVSPWIPAGTVFRAPSGAAQPFDHCSLIATILKWRGVDPASAGLGARVAVAPTFEAVLSETLRSDVPRFQVPAGYAGQNNGALGFVSAAGIAVSDIVGCVNGGGSAAEITECLMRLKSGKS